MKLPPEHDNDDHAQVIGGYVHYIDSDEYGIWVNIEHIVSMCHSQSEAVYSYLDLHMDTSDTELPSEHTVKWHRVFTPDPFKLASDIALAL